MKKMSEKFAYLEFEIEMCKHSIDMLKCIVNRALGMGLDMPETRDAIKRKQHRLRVLQSMYGNLINL